jgi:hypothetical protein
LLRLAIAQGLSNRDAFVEKVGSFLEDKMGQNPEDAEKYGQHIMGLLENLNDELLFEKVFRSDDSKTNKDLAKQVEELTKVLKELGEKVDKLGK